MGQLRSRQDKSIHPHPRCHEDALHGVDVEVVAVDVTRQSEDELEARYVAWRSLHLLQACTMPTTPPTLHHLGYDQFKPQAAMPPAAAYTLQACGLQVRGREVPIQVEALHDKSRECGARLWS